MLTNFLILKYIPQRNADVAQKILINIQTEINYGQTDSWSQKEG